MVKFKEQALTYLIKMMNKSIKTPNNLNVIILNAMIQGKATNEDTKEMLELFKIDNKRNDEEYKTEELLDLASDLYCKMIISELDYLIVIGLAQKLKRITKEKLNDLQANIILDNYNPREMNILINSIKNI